MAKKGVQIAVGVSIAIVTYLVLRQVAKSIFKKTGSTPKGDSSFVGADGKSLYAAKFYDSEHINQDGSKGATWISYQDSPIVGFWKKGMIAEGTQVSV